MTSDPKSRTSLTKAPSKIAPIGIFDSGVGGLSIWDEIRRKLPGEKLLYFADSGRCPYGGRSPEDIYRFAEEIVRFLLSKKCKLIVAACNTVTAGAIDRLRRAFDVPFIGVEPAIKSAVSRTSTGHIGVLATEFTLASDRYKRLVDLYAGSVRVHYEIGSGLVEIIEEGIEDSPKSVHLLKKHLEGMKALGVDQLILGCTHYPFLRRRILEIMGPHVVVHDPAEAVARRTEAVLNERGLEATRKPGKLQPFVFFTTADDPQPLKRRLDVLLPGGTWNEGPTRKGYLKLELRPASY